MATLVSAYYRIPNKQSHEFYEEHLHRFFRFFADRQIIFFCETETWAIFEKYTNVQFVCMPFSKLPILERIPLKTWEISCKLDPEIYHTPELGAIWACKKEFLRIAAERVTSDWLIWIDAGCVRDDEWEIDCKKFTERRLHSLEPGIYLQLLNPIPDGKVVFHYPDGFIAGAIIAAHRKHIKEFCDFFNYAVGEYIKNKLSITSDQYIMAYMTTYKSPWLHTIGFKTDLTEIDRLYCLDSWFFFLMWL